MSRRRRSDQKTVMKMKKIEVLKKDRADNFQASH